MCCHANRIDDRKVFSGVEADAATRQDRRCDSTSPDCCARGGGAAANAIGALGRHVCEQRIGQSFRARCAETGREIVAGDLRVRPARREKNDPEVSDVLVMVPDSVWVERNGVLESPLRCAEGQLLS